MYPTTSMRSDYGLTEVRAYADGYGVGHSYSSLVEYNPDYRELRNVMLFETELIVAVAIIGAAIIVASVFERMRLLVPLGVLAIIFCAVALFYIALAAEGASMPAIGLSGNSVFGVEGFWGSSTSVVFGPSIGWFLLFAIIAALACMIVFVLRGRGRT
jgi:hypothetical protein